MPFRIHLNGTQIECDTAGEAISLLRSAREADVQTDYRIQSVPPTMGIYPVSAKPRNMRVSSTVKDFLSALQEAYPGPMTTEQLAARLGTTPKGLPAVVMGIRVLLRRWNADFDAVIRRTRRVEGEQVIRQYQLTTNGLKILQEQASEREPEIRDVAMF